MAVKIEKEKKTAGTKSGLDKAVKVSKASPKKKSKDEDADASDVDDDIEDDAEDVEDDWAKSEEEDNWDPDFEEFDMPKKSAKKPGKFKKADEDDEFSLDEDLKGLDDDDLFDEKDEFDDDF